MTLPSDPRPNPLPPERAPWPKWMAVLPLLSSLLAIGIPALLHRHQRPVLLDVGPRLISNQTSQPLSLYGRQFQSGMTLKMSGPISRQVPVTVRSPMEAYVRLPADLALPDRTAEASVTLTLEPGEGQVQLQVVNDERFPDPYAMALSTDGQFVAVISPTTDELVVWDVTAHTAHRVHTGDGPIAIAAFEQEGESRFAIVHQFEGSLLVFKAARPETPPVRFPAPTFATGIEIGPGPIAYVAERVTNTVRALDLKSGGQERWKAEVAPHPRELARVGTSQLAVGSLGTGEIELLALDTGRLLKTLAPTSKTSIVGGGTERFSSAIMGGKAVRDLVALKDGTLLVSSIGPNIGPNPQRMEVSMNSGVGIVRGEQFVRHVGLGAGVLEGLAVDEKGGLVFAADVASGTVKIFRLEDLLKSDATSRHALLQTLPILPPDGSLLVRPAPDFTQGLDRSAVPQGVGREVHSGPRSLALTPDGDTLYVLNRFSGRLAFIDVSHWREEGGARVTQQLPLFVTMGETERRMGEILYYADLGRTAMSCDACHLDGETEGVLFEKTHPLRIYRSIGIRGARETPPFFTPASTRSMEETMKEVGNRNRFQHLPLSGLEIERLSIFTRTLTPWPNPYRDDRGAPWEKVPLPNHAEGSPARGRVLFEAHCASCHPGPHFTLDQDPKTRGRYVEVGTPKLMPLREAQQDSTHVGFAIPSLIGLWDQFPLLGTGSAGFSVRSDGTLQTERAPLMELLERSGPEHGNAAGMTQTQRNDLMSYLLTL